MNVDCDSVNIPQFTECCDCTIEDCHCDEETVNEWTWDKEHSTSACILSECNLEVEFHSVYSSGTAVIRGNKLLEKGRHHYWEIKMLTVVYGTDTMVGVGTSKADIHSTKDSFCSVLGIDQESFGFSYHGYIQHGGTKRDYGLCFQQGSLVGIHLDTWRGTLEFFLNRKSLGIAFTGLQHVTLYPMVSTTAADSRIKLVNSCSIPVSLQVECLLALKSTDRMYLADTIPGLRHLSRSIFAIILNKSNNEEKDDMEYPAEGMILDEFDYALVGAGRKRRKIFTHAKDISGILRRSKSLQ